MNSSAFVVGASNGPARVLIKSARKINFESVKAYSGLREAEQELALVPTCFFLFAPVPDITSLADIITSLRACKRRDTRFSPLIYFCNTSSREVVRGCVAMGFDDVIAMPFSQDYFESRLMRVMNRVTTYCETPSYFGPAREGQVTLRRHYSDLHPDTGKSRIIRFVRSFSAGVNIIKNARTAA